MWHSIFWHLTNHCELHVCWPPRYNQRILYRQDSKLSSSIVCFPYLLLWFKLVYGSFGQNNMPCTVHSISAKTSQGGIKCTKVPKVLLSNLYTVNHSIAGKNIPSKLIKNLLIETKKNLLAMPSRADKGKCDICLQERHSSFCCTFCFYLRRRKKVLLK